MRTAKIISIKKEGDKLVANVDGKKEPWGSHDILLLLSGDMSGDVALSTKFKGGVRLDFESGRITPL